jgi:small conductance mechanosensitive channel
VDVFNDFNWEHLAESAVRVAIILAVILIVVRFSRHAIDLVIGRTVRARMLAQPAIEVEKRIETLRQVTYGAVTFIGILVALMTVLPEMGVNTTALLAGTSLIGLAVGFGAQSLVKDIISGLFILFENQYAKGDVVNIAGVGGVVEDITLRTTVLRDLDGAIHSVPNGQVNVATNLTRTWSRANMIVSVSYAEDMDHVFGVINRVGDAMAADPDWTSDIIEAPQVLGIESFGDSGVDIRVLGVTQPIRQWDVMRELRRRLKIEFDREGIEIPYPHRTLVTSGAKATDAMVLRVASQRG